MTRGVDVRELAAVFVGGAAGAAVRTALGVAFPAQAGQWPWTTFAINVAGAALLAYVATRLQERLPPSSYRRPLLGTGLCGGLTTFSTMQVEALHLIDDGAAGLAAGYLATSAAVGVVVIMLTTALVRRTRVRARARAGA